MEEYRYIMGIDGGGTKSNICIQNRDTGGIISLTGAELNCNGNSRETIRSNLCDIMRQAFKHRIPVSLIDSIFLGTAGYSNPDTRLFLQDCFTSMGYSGKMVMTGDCQTALCGALDKQWGAVIISGTGSVCYGRSSIGEYQCGGGGYLLDDGGSGFEIGRMILNYALRALDGRIPPNRLTELLNTTYGISSRSQLIQAVYSDPAIKKKIASYAPLLMDAFEHAPSLSREIVSHTVKELVELSIPVINHLHLEKGDIALCGSIFKYYLPIQEEYCHSLSQRFPQLCIRMPSHDAAYGAMMIAKEMADITKY